MEFSSMIIKNIKHNIRNYTAYLLGNSIIQCILFMFFTLVFSPQFIQADEAINLKANLISVVILMVAFSIIFIIFATVSFTKYRGKEFGVYFTIGLTSKEIIKILCYEDIMIALISFIFAALGGSVFSKLFHMAIGKILKIDNIIIPLSFKAYGTVLLISAGTCLFTLIYQMIFLKRYSVINILKSKSKKDIGSTGTILGIIGIIIFISSIIIFKMSINQEIVGAQNLLPASILGTIVSVYLLIGYSMTVVVKVLRKFKGTYNNNILFVNSLSHRFMSYRTVLFVVTLMVSGAMAFISVAYGMYKSTERHVEIKYPYDMSFIVDKDGMANNNIKDIVTKNLGQVQSYIELEGLNIPDIRVDEQKCLLRDVNILLISEDSYRNLGKDEPNLKKGEVMYCHAEKRGSFLDAGFMLELSKKQMDSREVSLDEYKNQHMTDEYVYVPKENKRDEVDTTINEYYSDRYSRGEILVVNNEDYKTIKEKLGDEAITYDVLVNLKNNEGTLGIKDTLESNLGKKVSDTLVIKGNEFDSSIKENGFMLFMFSFMGMMFLIGSAAVLYFKTITSIEEDRERSKQLMKIGLSRKEINKLSIQELGAVFLVPPVIALTCTGYFLSVIFKIINDGENMWKNSLFVFAVYSVIQIVFYCITSSKYNKQINRI